VKQRQTRGESATVLKGEAHGEAHQVEILSRDEVSRGGADEFLVTSVRQIQRPRYYEL